MDCRCQCGAVRFKSPLDAPLAIFVCHCIDCRRQSASAFGITASFPRFDLPDEAMKNVKSFEVTADSGRVKQCLFCERCGTRLMHRSVGNERISIKGGTLESLSKELVDKAVHIWTKRAVIPIPAGAEQYPEEPTSK